LAGPGQSGFHRGTDLWFFRGLFALGVELICQDKVSPVGGGRK
jgi:hypothetical protein